MPGYLKVMWARSRPRVHICAPYRTGTPFPSERPGGQAASRPAPLSFSPRRGSVQAHRRAAYRGRCRPPAWTLPSPAAARGAAGGAPCWSRAGRYGGARPCGCRPPTWRPATRWPARPWSRATLPCAYPRRSRWDRAPADHRQGRPPGGAARRLRLRPATRACARCIVEPGPAHPGRAVDDWSRLERALAPLRLPRPGSAAAGAARAGPVPAGGRVAGDGHDRNRQLGASRKARRG